MPGFWNRTFVPEGYWVFRGCASLEFRGALGPLGGQVNDQSASGDEGAGASFDYISAVSPVQNA